MRRKYIIPVCNISYMAHGPLIMVGSTGCGNSQRGGINADPSKDHPSEEAKGNTFIDEDEDVTSPANYDLWK